MNDGISVAGLGVELDGARILTDVTAELPQQRVAVIGANGSGKSTFARALNGLVRPSEGSVHVAGTDVGREPRRARERVGFLFSSPDAQILMPTPAEDIVLSLKAAGVARADREERALAELARFGLAGRADQPAHSLSGGQKQLLALAAVLASGPRVLVADEPTTLLDLGNARHMGDLLIEGDVRGPVADQVVIVTHDLELAARCDVVLRFADGRLAEQGEAGPVIDRYRAAYA
ncbi:MULTISPECIES: energy-coupling factor ABC transporter ATP-binding protein [unclassified Microbacterium]|uniref:energy-coupling factor ABC transporter ATP-binding protein n=1 Tax=unclassified Microbacterium TaxID=2609290 RepID=UPI00097EAEA6|nr:ABC transporter ATP-binding protein [Microbacterium sp. JB110]RCS63045.1 ABC transporter ATP-binding protein [Microbacterium sp. JB110]SJM60463.1 ATPase component BioM of energizing module of biotin ECF transporter [Frigoribacterium sp. JB110]